MCKRLAAIVAVLIAAAAHADVELTLRMTRGKAAATTTRLTLGGSWFRAAGADGSATYDFARRRVLRVDAKQRLTDDSLFAEVDGRERELENRAFLGAALDAGSVAENPLSLTLAEHQMSMRRDAARPTGIEARDAGGARRYLWKGKELMAWSTELLPVKPAARDRFVSYVRYMMGGHPEILADLQRLDGIPKWLLSASELGDATRIEVSGIAETTDAQPLPPPGAKELFDDPQMAAARKVTPESRDAAVAAIVAEASAAADAKKPLQALLGYTESTLMTGGALPPEFFGRKEPIVADADVQAFLRAMNPQNSEAGKAAVKTLTRLQPAAGPKAYVVAIFRADVEMKLGDTEAARKDFRTVLAKNPLITGVWKDLGDVLARTYHSVEAWRCFETARRIKPEHSMLKQVADEEARLLRDHPEFF